MARRPHPRSTNPGASADGAIERIAALPCWRGPVEVEPLSGGLSNLNFRVRCAGERFVARIGPAVTPHPIDRAAEIAATRAAAEAGLCPELVHAGAGALVLRHVDGRTLAAGDLADSGMLRRVADLLATCRARMPALYRGPALDRSLPAILSHYAGLLGARPNRWRAAARRLAADIRDAGARLAGQTRGFVHNDIHAGNILDDGERLWLVDWEYAGFGLPIGDLASLAVNGGFDATADTALLALAAGRGFNVELYPAFAAARLATALRDLLWGYAQDAFGGGFEASEAYIAVNEQRVRAAVQALGEGGGVSPITTASSIRDPLGGNN